MLPAKRHLAQHTLFRAGFGPLWLSGDFADTLLVHPRANTSGVSHSNSSNPSNFREYKVHQMILAHASDYFRETLKRQTVDTKSVADVFALRREQLSASTEKNSNQSVDGAVPSGNGDSNDSDDSGWEQAELIKRLRAQSRGEKRLPIVVDGEHHQREQERQQQQQQQPQLRVVQLSIPDPDDMLFRVLQFCYEGDIEISDGTCMPLLSLANYLRMPALKARVEKFLRERVTRTNVLLILNKAMSLPFLPAPVLQDVIDRCLIILAQNFSMLLSAGASLNFLPLHVIHGLLSHPALSVASEFLVYTFVCEYLTENASALRKKAHAEGRRQHHRHLPSHLFKKRGKKKLLSSRIASDPLTPSSAASGHSAADASKNNIRSDGSDSSSESGTDDFVGGSELDDSSDTSGVLSLGKRPPTKIAPRAVREQLFACVRFPFLTFEQLATALAEPLVPKHLLAHALLVRVGRTEGVQPASVDSLLLPSRVYGFYKGAPPFTDDAPPSGLQRRLVSGLPFEYGFDYDERGVLYFIGTKNSSAKWRNPCYLEDGITVASSSVEKGDPISIANRKPVEFWTMDVPSSWVQIDLGMRRRLKITHVTLRHGHATKQDVLQSWVFQQGLLPHELPNEQVSPGDEVHWQTLSRVRPGTLAVSGGANGPDLSLAAAAATAGPGQFATASWKIDGPAVLSRFFRVLQTGRNSSNHDFLSLSGIELYGELYEY